MTDQEIFDKVLSHLRHQRHQSVSSAGDCLYRGPNGTSCAIGCLIPDELYFQDLEGKAIRNVLNFPYDSSNGESLKKFFKGNNVRLLSDLQTVHDQDLPRKKSKTGKSIKMRNMELNMKKVAEDFNLLYTPE